jgi:hypothetical protein
VRALKDSGCLAPGVTRVHPKETDPGATDTVDTDTQETGTCGLTQPQLASATMIVGA